jgi:hypothetical protein
MYLLAIGQLCRVYRAQQDDVRYLHVHIVKIEGSFFRNNLDNMRQANGIQPRVQLGGHQRPQPVGHAKPAVV